MVPPMDDKVRKAGGGREGQRQPWGHCHSQPGLCGLNIPLALCHSARCGTKGMKEQWGQEAVSKLGGGLLSHEGQALTEGRNVALPALVRSHPLASRLPDTVKPSQLQQGQTDLRCSDVMAESLVRLTSVCEGEGLNCGGQAGIVQNSSPKSQRGQRDLRHREQSGADLCQVRTCKPCCPLRDTSANPSPSSSSTLVSELKTPRRHSR